VPFRGGPAAETVAEQAAWADEQCCDLKLAADKATVVREAAQDRPRVLLAQAEVVRSLVASVRQAYELADIGDSADSIAQAAAWPTSS
jgi:hypothetical protein